MLECECDQIKSHLFSLISKLMLDYFWVMVVDPEITKINQSLRKSQVLTEILEVH